MTGTEAKIRKATDRHLDSSQPGTDGFHIIITKSILKTVGNIPFHLSNTKRISQSRKWKERAEHFKSFSLIFKGKLPLTPQLFNNQLLAAPHPSSHRHSMGQRQLRISATFKSWPGADNSEGPSVQEARLCSANTCCLKSSRVVLTHGTF